MGKKRLKTVIFSMIGLAIACSTICSIIFLYPALVNEYYVWNPVTSPENQIVAFRCFFVSFNNVLEYQRETDDLDYFLSRRGDICVENVNGTDFRRLTTGGQVSNPAWSPDGNTLAWLYGRSNPIEDWKIIRTWNRKTYEYIDFPLPTEIDINPGSIAWSIDGKYIFIQGSGGILDVITGEYIPLPPQPVHGEAFDFYRSLDGSSVIYTEYLNWPDVSSGEIVIKHGDAGPYFFKQKKPFDFSLSPDGALLEFPDNSAADIGVFPDLITFVHLKTGEAIVYQSTDEIIIDSKTWSLDGTQLAITDNADLQLLTIVKNDDGIPMSVIEHPIISFCEINCPYIDGGLAFTPDGQHLIAGMNYKLWIINIDQQEGELFPINRSN